MKRLTTAVICIASALTASTALAQRESNQQPGQQPGLQQPGLQQPGISATGRHGTQVRATKIIGAEVKTSQGESLGRIEDIVINPSNGRAEFAVINCENKLVPVPFKVLTPSSTGAATTPGAPPTAGMERISFTTQIGKDKLENAPTISDRTRWSELQQPTFSQRVYSHYGVQAEGVGAPGSGIERGPGQQGREKKDSSDTEKSDTEKEDKGAKQSPN